MQISRKNCEVNGVVAGALQLVPETVWTALTVRRLPKQSAPVASVNLATPRCLVSVRVSIHLRLLNLPFTVIRTKICLGQTLGLRDKVSCYDKGKSFPALSPPFFIQALVHWPSLGTVNHIIFARMLISQYFHKAFFHQIKSCQTKSLICPFVLKWLVSCKNYIPSDRFDWIMNRMKVIVKSNDF